MNDEAPPKSGAAPLENRVLLEEIVRAIVLDPSAVRVDEIQLRKNAVELTIQCAEKDRGKVIGRGGETIYAIRKIFMAVGGIDQKSIQIRVLETAGSRIRTPPRR